MATEGIAGTRNRNGGRATDLGSGDDSNGMEWVVMDR